MTPDPTSPRLLKVSYETIRKVANQLDRRELTRRRFGRLASEKLHAPRTARVRTVRPLERVEVDNFLIDTHLVCGRTGVVLGRPWLTLAIDHYSGMVLGYYLSYAPPSATSILGALRNAILPKAPVQATSVSKALAAQEGLPALSGQSWVNPAMGIPDTIVVDNGLDLISTAAVSAFTSLNIETIYAPPRMPWYKGTIERFGRSLNTRFVHWTKGTTLGREMKGYEYDAREHASVLYEDFRELLDYYIVNIHNMTPQREKMASPMKRWMEGVSKWPVRLPSADSFDAIFALSTTKVLSQTGVTLAGLMFNSEDLGALWNRVGGVKVRLRVDPLDIRWIHVLDPRDDSPIKVPCTYKFDHARPYSYHLQVRRWARKEGHNPDDMAALSAHEAAFRAAIEEAARKGKANLRRMQASLSADLPQRSMTAPGARLTASRGSAAPTSELDKFLELSRLDEEE